MTGLYTPSLELLKLSWYPQHRSAFTASMISCALVGQERSWWMVLGVDWLESRGVGLGRCDGESVYTMDDCRD